MRESIQAFLNNDGNGGSGLQKFVKPVLLVLGILLLFIVSYRQGVKTFDYRQFSSAYCEKDAEKTISDNPEFQGIFTYGPYFNLGAGEYEAEVRYDSDEDRHYDLTANFGSTKIREDTLLKNAGKATIRFTLDSDVTDKSLEFRTYYDGQGSLTFYSLKVTDPTWILKGLAGVVCMLLAWAFSMFFLRQKDTWITAYIVGSSLMLYPAAYGKVILCVITLCLQLLLLLFMKFTKVSPGKALLQSSPAEIIINLLSGFLLTSSYSMLRYKATAETLDLAGKVGITQFMAVFVSSLHVLAALHLLMNRRVLPRGSGKDAAKDVEITGASRENAESAEMQINAGAADIQADTGFNEARLHEDAVDVQAGAGAAGTRINEETAGLQADMSAAETRINEETAGLQADMSVAETRTDKKNVDTRSNTSTEGTLTEAFSAESQASTSGQKAIDEAGPCCQPAMVSGSEALSAARRTGRSISGSCLMLSAALFGLIISVSYRNIWFCVGIIAILGFFFYYTLKWEKDGMVAAMDCVKSYRAVLIAVLAMSVLCAGFFAYQTVMRNKVFHSGCFDFGLFSQMYEYMAKTGLPLTTCERGYLLSHFYIHFSPIYYIFLPIYMIFRSPETLLVIQSVMVFAAVIPLFGICRNKKVPPVLTGLICGIYLLSPAICMPLFFDFHENKFVPFFVFCFIYFFLEKKNVRALIFLLLSLSIKEEAALYLIILALYFMICEKEMKRGAVVLGVSAVWFVLVMWFIASGGLGLMEGHYGLYYLAGEEGMGAMAKNIVLNPAFFIKNIFADDNIPFIFYTLGSLMFIPLAAKNPGRLMLMIPYVAFNLMTTYKYQHDIGFQYTYAPMALMMLLFILNLMEFPSVWRYTVGFTCICAGIILIYCYKGDGLTIYPKTYKADAEVYEAREEYLQSFDSDVSITAETYLVSHLYFIDELYEFKDNNELDTEYVLLLESSDYSFKEDYKSRGYEYEDTVAGIQTYHKAEN